MTLKSACTFVLLLLSTALFAQKGDKNEGVIEYRITTNLHKLLPPEQEALKARLPETQTFSYELLFNAEESLFRFLEDEEETSGGGFMMQMARQTETYLNWKERLKLEPREVAGTAYLIQDSLSTPAWKLSMDTEEVRVLKGFKCKKAVLQDTARKQEIVAWYTEEIRVPSGPQAFHSLPGMIMEININEGAILMVPTSVKFRKLKKNEMKRPSGGKQVSNAQFREEMEELRKKNGGRGGFMFRN
jgi:GLPGLI family protein